MRRAGDLWQDVVAFDALLAAANHAARGKRFSRSAAGFLERAEFEVLALLRELEAGTWMPARAHEFIIHDPKVRTISAIPFRDQVVHHALMGVLEPIFERRMIHDSYACRKGKGQHAALARAQRRPPLHALVAPSCKDLERVLPIRCEAGIRIAD